MMRSVQVRNFREVGNQIGEFWSNEKRGFIVELRKKIDPPEHTVIPYNVTMLIGGSYFLRD